MIKNNNDNLKTILQSTIPVLVNILLVILLQTVSKSLPTDDGAVGAHQKMSNSYNNLLAIYFFQNRLTCRLTNYSYILETSLRFCRKIIILLNTSFHYQYYLMSLNY